MSTVSTRTTTATKSFPQKRKKPLSQKLLICLIFTNMVSMLGLGILLFVDGAWITAPICTVASLIVLFALVGAIRARHGVMMFYSVFTLLWGVFMVLFIFIIFEKISAVLNSELFFKLLVGQTLLNERTSRNLAAISAVNSTTAKKRAPPTPGFKKPLYLGLCFVQLGLSIMGLLSTCMIPIDDDFSDEGEMHGQFQLPNDPYDSNRYYQQSQAHYYTDRSYNDDVGRYQVDDQTHSHPHEEISPSQETLKREHAYQQRSTGGFRDHVRKSLRKSRVVLNSIVSSSNGRKEEIFEFDEHISNNDANNNKGQKKKRNLPGQMKRDRERREDLYVDSYHPGTTNQNASIYVDEEITPEDYYAYGDFRGRKSQHWRLE